MNKVYNFPHLLPKSVLNTIASDSPNPNYIEQDNFLSAWYKLHNTPVYRTSIYFKGPILFMNTYSDPESDWISYDNPNRYKLNVKTYLVKDVQSKYANDDTHLWVPENFPLNAIAGLRTSARLKLKSPVHYGETYV